MEGVEREAEDPPQDPRQDVEDGGFGEGVDDVDDEGVEVQGVGGLVVEPIG